MRRHAFLSGVYGLGEVDSGVATMQAAMRTLSQRAKWPAVDPGRVDGELDQQTVQALVNVVNSLPGLPSVITQLVRYGVPAALVFGWSSSQVQTVRGQIRSHASEITKAVQLLTLRYTPTSSAPAPNATGAAGGAFGGQPMSLGLKVGIGLGVGGLVLLLALR